MQFWVGRSHQMVPPKQQLSIAVPAKEWPHAAAGWRPAWRWASRSRGRGGPRARAGSSQVAIKAIQQGAQGKNATASGPNPFESHGQQAHGFQMLEEEACGRSRVSRLNSMAVALCGSRVPKLVLITSIDSWFCLWLSACQFRKMHASSVYLYRFSDLAMQYCAHLGYPIFSLARSCFFREQIGPVASQNKTC